MSEDTTLSDQVKALEIKVAAQDTLLRVVLSTLILPRNKPHIPERVRKLAAGWVRQYRQIRGEEVSNGKHG